MFQSINTTNLLLLVFIGLIVYILAIAVFKSRQIIAIALGFLGTLLATMLIYIFPLEYNNQSGSKGSHDTIPPPGMVYLKGGEIIIGDSMGISYANPEHEVYVAPFFFDKNLVTNAEFKEFVEKTDYITTAEKRGGGYLLWANINTHNPDKSEFIPGANWKHPQSAEDNIKGKMDHPVVQVSLEDARAFATYHGKRLLSEIEWEYAARPNKNRDHYIWGNEWPPSKDYIANLSDVDADERWADEPIEDYYDGWEYTSPIGRYRANEYGIFDMAGNVWEWTNTRFSMYPYSRSWEDTTKTGARVVRGSAMNSSYSTATMISHRFGVAEAFSAYNIGFRYAKSLPSSK